MSKLASLSFIAASVVLLAQPAPAEEKTAPAKPATSATPAAKPAPEEVDVSARSKALEIAGAWSNDGYKIRDGFWPGEIEVGKPQFIEVNLFGGNEYWFSGAAAPPARKFAVTVYDETGKIVPDQNFYEGGSAAAAGIVAKTSGKYIVKVALLDGEKTDFCLLYSYK